MFVLLLLSLLVGLLLPVYTDEVAWRFQISRYLQDGVDRSLGETCGANTWAAPALFMLPLRVFSSAVTAWLSDPLWVRIAGVVTAIVTVAGMVAFVRQQDVRSARRATTEILVLALLGTGVLPFLLVWSRPDQPVLLAMLGSLLLAFVGDGGGAACEPAWRIAASWYSRRLRSAII